MTPEGTIGLINCTTLPLHRMIILDVGTKITDLQLRLLILKSSTGGVSFDIMNSVVFLSLHVNFSCKIVHTL